uniref:Uncharacterized protein n=1 Tax=Arundo donax TaxID=35708 RepID=A0A0A8Z9D8_ARUDO
MPRRSWVRSGLSALHCARERLASYNPFLRPHPVWELPALSVPFFIMHIYYVQNS